MKTYDRRCLSPDAQEALRLRLIVVKRNGKRVYLLTNVQESARLSRRMASEFYRAHWAIEVEYHCHK